MGETTCLMQQPFSYYSAGLPIDGTKGNPSLGLGQSVSFGRFMSESLNWEKWSTFSHNKYVEEAEKIARPGSVAEKKAFFEAHYKSLAARKAAAALLEQATAAAAAANEPEPESQQGVDNTTQESQIVTTNTDLDVEKQEAVASAPRSLLVPGKTGLRELFKTQDRSKLGSEQNKIEETNPSKEEQIPMEVIELHQSTEGKEMEKPLLKDFISDQFETVSTKPYFSKLLRPSKQQSSQSRLAVSLHSKREINASPSRKKSSIDSIDKKMLTPRTTNNSMNFTPVKEFNRMTSTIMRKIDCSLVTSTSKASTDCATPNRVSMQKYGLMTPVLENGRDTTTPLNPSISKSKTGRSKWKFLPTDCSKFMSGSKAKLRSPSISTPFSFRTEERAARRKEKLEEKFNANLTQKGQLPTKLKEKKETEIKNKLCQTLCFKAKPLPKFYRKQAASKLEEEPVLHPQTSKQKRASSLQKSSISNNGLKQTTGKNIKQQPTTLTSWPRTISSENASTNIR